MEKTRINVKTQKKNAKTKLDICFQHCFTERIIQRHTLAAAVCEILKHTMFMRYQIPTPFSVLQNEVSHGTGAQAQTMIPKKSVLKKSKFVKNFALCLNGVSDIVKLGKVQRIFILFGSTIVSPKETITIDITKVYTDDMKDIANTETDSYSKKVCRTLMREIVTNEEIANISKLPPRKIFIVLHLQEPMPPEYTSDIFLPKVQYRLPSRGVFHTFHLSSREHFENVCDDVVNGFVNLNLNEPDSGIGYWYASTLDLHGFKETLSAATDIMKVDNYEDLVKCGYLEMKLPRKHRKLGRQAWRRKWFILRRKSSQGGPRLEYHKSEESCLNAQNKTVVELKTLTKIDDSNKSKSRSITFKLIFEDTFLILSTQNTNNMNEWIRLIRKSVALPAPKPTPLLPVVEGSFQVTVIYTEDSESMNLAGEYLMVVTSEHLLLYRNSNVINRSDEVARNGSDGKSRSSEVAKWDLDDIPRFRLQKLNRLNDAEKIFIVNLARTSQTTEGEFQFLTQNGRAILETVKSRIKQRSRNNEDSPRSSPVEEVANSNSSFGVEASRSRSCSGRSHISHQSIPDSTVSKVSSTSDREVPTRLVSSDFSTF